MDGKSDDLPDRLNMLTVGCEITLFDSKHTSLHALLFLTFLPSQGVLTRRRAKRTYPGSLSGLIIAFLALAYYLKMRVSKLLR